MHFLLYLVIIRAAKPKLYAKYRMTNGVTNRSYIEKSKKPPIELEDEVRLECFDIAHSVRSVNKHTIRCIDALQHIRNYLVKETHRQVDLNIQLLSNFNNKFNQALKLFFAKCSKKHIRCKEGQCLLCLDKFEEIKDYLKEIEDFETIDPTKEIVPTNFRRGTITMHRTIWLDQNENKISNSSDDVDGSALCVVKKTKLIPNYEIIDEINYKYLEQTLARLEFNLNTYKSEAEALLEEQGNLYKFGLCFYNSNDELKDSFMFEDVKKNIKIALDGSIIRSKQWIEVFED